MALRKLTAVASVAALAAGGGVALGASQGGSKSPAKTKQTPAVRHVRMTPTRTHHCPYSGSPSDTGANV